MERRHEKEVKVWLAESHRLAESFAYDRAILQAARETSTRLKFAKINLPESYMQETGMLARKRIVAAGLRLGRILKDQ